MNNEQMKNWLMLVLVMTGTIYAYTAFIQPAIASYADPSMTFGFPLVMAAIITVVFIYVTKKILKKNI